jgi:hypothetical protein
MALPEIFPDDDPATPYFRIVIKESNVIRLVQWVRRKKIEDSVNRPAF